MRTLLFPLVLLLAHALTEQALAHAEFRGSDPAADAVVETLPDLIELTFSEPVSPLVMRFVADGADPVEVGARSEDTRVIVDVPEGAGQGTHLLSWRVVSVDGHPVGGTVVFSVGQPSRGYDLPTGQDGAARLAAAGRLCLTLALVVGVGATVFAAIVAHVPSSGTRRVGRAACLLVFPFSALAVAAQGLDMLAFPPRALLSAAPWLSGALSPTGLTAMTAALSSAVALHALSRRGASSAGALLAWALAALSFALSGHAAVADPRWLSAPSVALHALALIFWLGSLVPLLMVLRAGADAAPTVRRFSAIATPLVVVLLVTGGVLTLVQAGSPAALVQSAYGRILIVKLVAVAGLLAIAARNRLVHTPALAAGSASARDRLDRAIRLEVLLGLLVIALASGFRLTPPPRGFATTPPAFEAMVHGRQAMAELALVPGQVGRNAATLYVTDMAGSPLKPLAVALEASLPEQSLEPIRVEAVSEGEGVWRADPVNLPLAGDWQIEVDVLVSDFAQETLSLTVPVRTD